MASVRTLGITLTVAVIGASFACSREPLTLGTGVTGNTSFSSPDAADVAPDGGHDDASMALCIATTCPPPLATCPGPSGSLPDYACQTNLGNDVNNCGACNVQCRETSDAYNVHMACVNGGCRALCNDGYTDCNGIPDDGCESNTNEDAANCGACDVKCAADVPCVGGTCGCPPGTTYCDGVCVNLATNDYNCGACGRSCLDSQNQEDAGALFPHMYLACEDSRCKKPTCSQEHPHWWRDCNNHIDPDGCEVDINSDRNNCGGCGIQCEADQLCVVNNNGIGECLCKPGQTLCGDPSSAISCTDTDNDPYNCGACGYVCQTALTNDVTAICERGHCKTQCSPGRADCNGLSRDGCEVDVTKDPRNCGACGVTCDLLAGQPCIEGQCLMRDCNQTEPK